MADNRSRLAILAVATLALLIVIGLAVQGSGSSGAAPTIDVSRIQTNAVGGFVRGLTETMAAVPTATATSTGRPTATAGGTPTTSATPSCLGLHFVRDVTIPDNTQMTPAQVFTKTWQVENSGTCPWKPGFQVVLIGGVAMGGSPFNVAQTVGPGGMIQISIKMAAPTNVKGVAQGTWQMADDNGERFGDYVSVVIVVGNGTASPQSPTITSTP